MRLCTAAACWILIALLPLTAAALGLGNISLNSALNEPFAADIPLQSVGTTDLNQVKVALASNDTFERYDLDKPAFLNDFKFSIAENARGEPIVRIVSATPVAEPFVTLLLDIKWPSGRLLREYTVLLDPPLFEAASVPQNVTAAETVAPVELDTAGQVERQSETVQEPVQQAEQIISAAPADPEPVEFIPASDNVSASVTQESEPQAASAPLAAGTYVAQRGDTLWQIAQRTRGDVGLSSNQMMLALFSANPEAFLGNINALKAGAILRIPDQQKVLSLSVREANAEARGHHAAWAEGPVTISSRAEPSKGQLQLVVPGTDDTFVSEQGVAGGGNADAGSRVGELEIELEESQRLLQIRDTELQALQQRISELEQTQTVDGDVVLDEEALPASEMLDAEILVDTIDDFADSPFADDAELLPDDSLTSSEGVESGAPALLEGATDEQPDASRVVELPEQDESSVVGELLGSYWLWGTAALVLLLALFLARRRRAGDPDATGTWDDEDTRIRVAHDQTIKDFSDLPSFDESIVVDEPDKAVIVDEVDEALIEDAAEPVEFQEPEAEPEAAPIFDATAEASLLDAADDQDEVELPEVDSLPEHEAVADSPDTARSTASLEQLDEAAALDDDVELPLEKTISTGAPLNLDQADPIAEAEFHMAYGLYDQAADLLVRALESESDNRVYRVKLIEVYFVWEHKEGFLEQAIILHETIGDSSDSDWNKVLILGKQLCPDAELFEGVDAAAPTADSMDLELSDVGETEVDFTLGGTEVQALDENALDFDLGSDLGDEGLEHDLALDLSDEDAAAGAQASDLALNLGDADATADGVDPDQTLSVDDGDLAVTMESPTIENPMIESSLESPTLDIDLGDIEATDAGDTMESPTLDVLGATSDTAEMPTLNEDSLTDPTSLDVDLSGLGDLPVEDEVEDTGLVEVDSTLNQLDNTGELLTQEDMDKTIADDEATALVKAVDIEDTMAADETSSDTVEQPQLERSDDGDTAEQPEFLVDDEQDIDAESQGDATMTEVGTKLDLARAYIDMGDPDGARSILNEVLDEGGDSQQQEARQLLEELED